MNFSVIKFYISHEPSCCGPPYGTIWRKHFLWKLEKRTHNYYILCTERNAHVTLPTLIHPVRDAVKNLVLFSIVCHLNSLSHATGAYKNVEVWDVGLQNTPLQHFFWGGFKVTLWKYHLWPHGGSISQIRSCGHLLGRDTIKWHNRTKWYYKAGETTHSLAWCCQWLFCQHRNSICPHVVISGIST